MIYYIYFLSYSLIYFFLFLLITRHFRILVPGDCDFKFIMLYNNIYRKKRYVPAQYKTQQMCDKAVDDCLAALKFVPSWFVASIMIKALFTALYAHENILYFNEDSSNVVFISNGMGILNIDLNNINLDNTNYDEEDPDTIILIRLLSWHIKFEKTQNT